MITIGALVFSTRLISFCAVIAVILSLLLDTPHMPPYAHTSVNLIPLFSNISLV